MSLKNLSDDELLISTELAGTDERNATSKLLEHLAEVEIRKAFFKKECSSLFNYCVRILKKSDPDAARAVNGARGLIEVPEIKPKIDSGELTITALNQAHSFFKQEARVNNPISKEEKKEILLEISQLTTREAEKVLIAKSSNPQKPKKEKKRIINQEYTELKFVVDKETLENLERLKEIWSHELNGQGLSELIKKMTKICKEKVDPINKAKRAEKRKHKKTPALELKEVSTQTQKKHRSRNIPAHIKHQVWIRDQGKCTYNDCGSKYLIQEDHIIPFAMGGEHTVENLRLRCAAHNQLHAMQSYGAGVLKYTEVYTL